MINAQRRCDGSYPVGVPHGYGCKVILEGAQTAFLAAHLDYFLKGDIMNG